MTSEDVETDVQWEDSEWKGRQGGQHFSGVRQRRTEGEVGFQSPLPESEDRSTP